MQILANLRGLHAKLRDLRVKLRDGGLNLINLRGFIANLPRERGISRSRPHDREQMATIRSERERARTRGRALTSEPGWSATGEGEQTDQSGPTPGGTSTDRRGPGPERVGVADFRRSEPLDQG